VLKLAVIAGVVEAPWSGWEEMNNGFQLEDVYWIFG
jgi:hypothetical protein